MARKTFFALLAAALAAAASAACGPTPQAAPSAEPEIHRKANLPGAATPNDPDKPAVKALGWKKNTPDRITVTLTERAIEGAPPEVTFTYAPNPPDVFIDLAPPPGTPSFEITAVEVTWTFKEPAKDDQTKLGPTKLPIVPVKVTGAPTDQAGPTVRVQVPLDPMLLKGYFTDPDETNRVTSASAVIRFLDDKGNGIIGAGGATDLKIPVPVALL